MTRRWSTLGLVTFAALAAMVPAAGAQQTPSSARVTAKHTALARAMEEAHGAQQEVLRRQMASLRTLKLDVIRTGGRKRMVRLRW
ncbi:MAG: hypothetical protein ACYC1S_06350 [Gemmatimonadaceae bacterium]